MRANAVDVVVNVDAIDDGAFVAVFHDEVLLKKAEGLLIGGSGQADDEGIEVFQHAAPLVVNAAVAFIDDDDVKGVDGYSRVVTHLFRRLCVAFGLVLEQGAFFVLRVQLGFTGKNGVHALDGGDTDI